MDTEKHDIVIPLGVKSFSNQNFEIKVAVASIKKFCTFVNRIIIVTQIEPIKELGDDIIWIYQDDIYTHDKDANIIEKVRQAIEQVPDLTDDFLMWSDDQFVTKETNWIDTKPRYMKVYNERTKDFFEQKAYRRIWWKRLLQVFKRFPNGGMGLKFWNPHIPSPLNKHKFMKMCNTFNYKEENGITIYTLYYNFIKEIGVPNFDEFHCQKGELDWKNCRWVGYFNSSMRVPAFKLKLQKMFDIK